jgi:hypothetical protein
MQKSPATNAALIDSCSAAEEKISRGKKGSKEKKPPSPAQQIRWKELSARSLAGQAIHNLVLSVSDIADGATAAKLSSTFKPVMDLDVIAKASPRNISLSTNPTLLLNLDLNSKEKLDSVLRDFTHSVCKETMSATVTIPYLLPALNVIIPQQYNWYKITAILGRMNDLIFTGRGYLPHPVPYKGWFTRAETDWLCAHEEIKSPINWELSLSAPHNSHPFSLLLFVAISFGTGIDVTEVSQAHGQGAIKIIDVG